MRINYRSEIGRNSGKSLQTNLLATNSPRTNSRLTTMLRSSGVAALTATCFVRRTPTRVGIEMFFRPVAWNEDFFLAAETDALGSFPGTLGFGYPALQTISVFAFAFADAHDNRLGILHLVLKLGEFSVDDFVLIFIATTHGQNQTENHTHVESIHFNFLLVKGQDMKRTIDRICRSTDACSFRLSKRTGLGWVLGEKKNLF